MELLWQLTPGTTMQEQASPRTIYSQKSDEHKAIVEELLAIAKAAAGQLGNASVLIGAETRATFTSALVRQRMLESEMPGSDLAEELVGSAIGTAGTLKGALENYASVKASGDATEISAAKAIVMNQVGGSESIATMTALAIQGMREDEYLQPEQSYAEPSAPGDD